METLKQTNSCLNSLQKRIQQARNDLQTYKEFIAHCQMNLIREVQLHSEAKATIDRLERHNLNLDNQLKRSQHEMHQARATISECECLNKALERRIELQADKIEFLEEELIKLRREANDADSNAQQSAKRVNQLKESLTRSDKELEETRLSNMQLEGELRAAAQNLHCVERAFERSSQQVGSADRRNSQLQQRLHETERRALQAELHVQQLQNNTHNLEQLEKRLSHIIFARD